MYLVTICREPSKHGSTFGTLRIYDHEFDLIYACLTLELPFRQNEKNYSSIPLGRYECTFRESARFGAHFQILDVPNRDFILIHFGNYVHDTSGCILVGNSAMNIDAFKGKEIISSKATMSKLLALLPKKFNLVIFNKNESN